MKAKKAAACMMALALTVSLLAGCGKKEQAPDAEGETIQETEKGESEKEAEETKETKKEAVTLRLGVQMTADTSFGKGAKEFAKMVSERTNGDIKVEVFTDGVLGDELEMWESIQAGTLDMCITSPGRISNFVPEYYIYELPYLFRDYDHRDAVAEGEIGQEIDQLLREKAGMVVLGQMGGSGRYLITKTKPVSKLSDTEGIKMRVQESQIVVDTWEQLGTLPVTVAYSETYTALQTGVANAAENELSTFVTMKWYEPCSYLTKTEHSIGLRPLIMSEKVFLSLSEEQQAILLECGREAAKKAVEYERKDEQEAFGTLESFGIQIVELENKQEWIDATQKIRDDFAQENHMEEYMEKIAEAGK